MTIRGNAQLQLILSLAAFAGSIVAPVLYVSDIKTDVALAEKDITIQKTTTDKLEKDQEYLRRLVEQIAIRNGVNVEKVRQEVITSTDSNGTH